MGKPWSEISATLVSVLSGESIGDLEENLALPDLVFEIRHTDTGLPKPHEAHGETLKADAD